MLDIVANYHCMQFQGKLMNQTWENGKKPSLGLGSLWPKFGLKSFFNGFYLYQMLDIVASYHCMQFQGKLMNQIWENNKRTLVSGPILAPLAQIRAPKIFSSTLSLLYVRHCSKLSLYAISRKTNEPNFRKCPKT